MAYVLVAFIGMIGGGVVVFLYLLDRIRKVNAEKANLCLQEQKLREAVRTLAAKQDELGQHSQQLA